MCLKTILSSAIYMWLDLLKHGFKNLYHIPITDCCGTGGAYTYFFHCLLLLYGPWGQRPVIKWRPPRLCRKKTKWRTELPEGFACPIPLQWGQFLRRGDVSFQVIWRTDLEVDLERTQNYCVESCDYFCQYKNSLPQPDVKWTCRLHLEIRFNLT